jgi:hypothetical protein
LVAPIKSVELNGLGPAVSTLAKREPKTEKIRVSAAVVVALAVGVIAEVVGLFAVAGSATLVSNGVVVSIPLAAKYRRAASSMDDAIVTVIVPDPAVGA